MSEFTSFPKIPRLRREVIVTEKIDGTNASVWIDHVVNMPVPGGADEIANIGEFVIRAGSRKRFITPENDNFGFAKWVKDHAEELVQLGEGVHFGEWWGVGIQRGYGLSERRFSLFNSTRWSDNNTRPACCHVVPQLFIGNIDNAPGIGMVILRNSGSLAAQGYDKPEGIVVYHTAANQMFKMTFEMDDTGKEQG